MVPIVFCTVWLLVCVVNLHQVSVHGTPNPRRQINLTCLVLFLVAISTAAAIVNIDWLNGIVLAILAVITIIEIEILRQIRLITR